MTAKLCLTFAAVCALGAAGTAQNDLLFTTLGNELTRSLLPPDSLQDIEPEDVMVVRPQTALHTASKYVPHDCFATLLGDEDNDGSYYEADLGRQIDAIFVLPAATLGGVNARRVFFSPAQQIDGAVSGAPIRPGDVARVAPGGQVKFFVTEEQVRSAFGIAAGWPVNIDAITADLQTGVVYLSLEDDVEIHGGLATTPATTVQDGAILAFPTTSLFTEPVSGVAPGSGYVVATETQVSFWVDASGVGDAFGAHPTTIGDLDGLDMDGQGGIFTGSSGVNPNLIFCGETLTGGGVLSTSGSVAIVNGTPLANVGVATDGYWVGLRASATGPRSLNGLQVLPQVCAFVTETRQPVLQGGSGVLQADIGGADPAGLTFLLAGFAPALPPAVAVPMTPFANTCFPEFVPYVANYFVPVNGDGFGTWAIPANYGNLQAGIVCQAVTLGAAGITLSTPLTIQLLP